MKWQTGTENFPEIPQICRIVRALQRCIKILFLQCNLTWKTEQLTNYKCSLIQYGDENDSEVLLYTDLPTLTILA
jgi:hypothetical protein